MRARLAGLVMALVSVLAASAAGAVDVQQIDWGALQSARELELRRRLQDLYVEVRTLSAEQQKALPRIAQAAELQELLDQGKLAADKLLSSQRALVDEKPAEKYPEAAAYAARIKAIKQELAALSGTPNDALNGARVRLSGYLLPLEVEGGAVSEFLLVPYVGACIHVPPPPPNQIVHVAMRGRYAAESVFAPVTVEGRLSSDPGKVDLYLADGNALVDRGYRLEAEDVRPAKSD